MSVYLVRIPLSRNSGLNSWKLIANSGDQSDVTHSLEYVWQNQTPTMSSCTIVVSDWFFRRRLLNACGTHLNTSRTFVCFKLHRKVKNAVEKRSQVQTGHEIMEGKNDNHVSFHSREASSSGTIFCWSNLRLLFFTGTSPARASGSSPSCASKRCPVATGRVFLPTGVMWEKKSTEESWMGFLLERQ
jgi:hypothetical protein